MLAKAVEKVGLIKKALEEIKESVEASPEIEVKWRKEEFKNLASAQSWYEGWDSCCASSTHLVKYFVVYDNGTSTQVPYGYYYQGYAANHTPDVEEKADVYVGDFLNENAIAVVRYDYDYSEYEDYGNGEEITVYLPEYAPRGELEYEIVERIKEVPVEKLYEILARLV